MGFLCVTRCWSGDEERVWVALLSASAQYPGERLIYILRQGIVFRDIKGQEYWEWFW